MKTTLINILWKKEVRHWRRVGDIYLKFDSLVLKLIAGTVVSFLVTMFHYLFAIMHCLYEIFLYIFMRKAFKANLTKLALKS